MFESQLFVGPAPSPTWDPYFPFATGDFLWLEWTALNATGRVLNKSTNLQLKIERHYLRIEVGFFFSQEGQHQANKVQWVEWDEEPGHDPKPKVTKYDNVDYVSDQPQRKRIAKVAGQPDSTMLYLSHDRKVQLTIPINGHLRTLNITWRHPPS